MTSQALLYSSKLSFLFLDGFYFYNKHLIELNSVNPFILVITFLLYRGSTKKTSSANLSDKLQSISYTRSFVCLLRLRVSVFVCRIPYYFNRIFPLTTMIKCINYQLHLTNRWKRTWLDLCVITIRYMYNTSRLKLYFFFFLFNCKLVQIWKWYIIGVIHWTTNKYMKQQE